MSERAYRSRDLLVLEALLERARSPLAFLDLRFDLVRVNPAYAALFGKAPEALPGSSLFELHPGQDRAAFQRAVETGQPITWQEQRVSPVSGASRWDALLRPRPELEGLVLSLDRVTDQEHARRSVEESEARFRLVLDRSPVAIYRRDLRANRYDYLSPGIETLTGYSVETFSSFSLEEVLALIHPEDVALVKDCLGRAAEPRMELEYRLRCSDGNYRWLADTATISRDASGHPSALDGAVQDLSARKQAEERLRESEARLSRAQEIAHLGSWELELASGRLTWSDEVYRIFGMTPQAVDPTYSIFLDLIHPEDREAVDAAYTGSLREGRDCYDLEHRIVRQDTGEVRVVHERCQHLRDADHQITRSIGMVHDITEPRQQREALRESALLHQTLIETTRMGYWLADRDGKLLAVNEAYARMSGYEEAELLRLTIPHLEASETAEDVRQHIALIHREGHAEFETRHRRKDGSVFDVEVRTTYLDVSGGRLVVFLLDISDRKAAERALHESEQRFRVLSEAMPQIVWSADPSGALDYFNPQSLDYTGLSLPELAGWNWESIVHPADVAMIHQLWQQCLESGQTLVAEQRLRRADGEHRWHLTRGVPLRDPEQRIVRWIGTATDIHDQKQAEHALREADRSKDEFLAMLAHELRNPLAPILNSVQIMRRAGDNVELRSRADTIIERQVGHMARLIDDLLDVSRITRRKVSLRRRPVTLGEIIETAVETSQPGLEAGGHQLSIQLPPEPVYLLADRMRLAQVLSNLLNNAAKYSPAGTPIELRASTEADHAVVSIRDRGIGIEPEMLPRVFDLFVQGDTAPARERGGLGVGLALARSLVELHGGSIQASSAGPGQGTEISVRLPLTPLPRARSAEAARDSSAQPATERLRILVVDDSIDLADSMTTLLSMAGHEVRSAHDGQTALELARSFEPHVVLLDIGMPQMTGYEVARRLRETRAGQRLLLIAMTGWGQEEDRRRSQAAGFDHHLTKPFELARLERLFQQRLGRPGDGAGNS